MGVIEDFPRAHDHVLRQLAPPERELFARFDTGCRPGEDAAERRSFGRS